MPESLGLISRYDRAAYYRGLGEVLIHCLKTGETKPLVRYVMRWIKRGAPIDPAIRHAPAATLEIVVRQVAGAMPGLGAWHKDALLWLTQPECRRTNIADLGLLGKPKPEVARGGAPFKPYSAVWIPWNILLHSPKDTPYYEYNRRGLTVEVRPDDEVGEDECRLSEVDEALSCE